MYKNLAKYERQRAVTTGLAKSLGAAENQKAGLDMICKKLLAHKNVLAWILKTCVEEYADCSLEEIEHKYIEGDPQISRTPVHRDELLNDNESNLSIAGRKNEDSSITEGTVTYDIIFNALNPLADGEIFHMIVNIEGQVSFHPGYPLIKRGIYYGSRMISAQYGTVFVKSHYEKLQKVYSIWICINPPKHRENSINLYSIKETQLVGNVKEQKKNYDLMDVVMVCLAKSSQDKSEGLIRMLSTLLSAEMPVSQKKEILEEEFGLTMSQTMEKEVYEMDDYGDYLAEKYMQRGLEKGMTQGMTQGILLAVKNLMQSMQWTSEQAMDALNIPEADRAKYAEIIKQ